MHKAHVKNTIRYYLLLIIVFAFLFFSSDFGLIDVQKTAIVMAVGIDRESDTFIVTSQIAVPQSSKQGSSTQTVEIVSRGKTVADAFEEINSKTGWYPKLVFCRLLIIGEKTAQSDVFDALDFFLLDEYMSDNCLIATCDGTAKDMLNVTALVDSSGSLAIQKILSSHAERVGAVLPSTLREFSIGYFNPAKCGFLPILKTQPQQEQIGNKQNSQNDNNQSLANSETSGSDSNTQKQDKPVFSASETALFVNGKRVARFTKEETFAFLCVQSPLKLATYSVDVDGVTYALTIKNNRRKQQISLSKDNTLSLSLQITLTAGMLDCSRSLPLGATKDSGNVPAKVFQAAETQLLGQIQSAFEKCQAFDCDIFRLQEHLQKHQFRKMKKLPEADKKQLLKNARLQALVTFQALR